MKLLLRGLLASRLSALRRLRRTDVAAPMEATVTASVTAVNHERTEQPWRSCVCAIESDMRDVPANLLNVCPILH
jgi:hypothetical protein